MSTSVHSICPRVHKCPLPFVHVSKSVHSICPRDHKCPLHLCTCPGAERQDGGPTVGTAAVRAGKDPQGDWIVSYIVFLFFFQLVFAYLWAQSKTDFAIKIPTIRYVPKNVALVEKISPPARQLGLVSALMLGLSRQWKHCVTPPIFRYFLLVPAPRGHSLFIKQVSRHSFLCGTFSRWPGRSEMHCSRIGLGAYILRQAYNGWSQIIFPSIFPSC